MYKVIFFYIIIFKWSHKTHELSLLVHCHVKVKLKFNTFTISYVNVSLILISLKVYR